MKKTIITVLGLAALLALVYTMLDTAAARACEPQPTYLAQAYDDDYSHHPDGYDSGDYGPTNHHGNLYVPVIVYDHVFDYGQSRWVWVNTHVDQMHCQKAATILRSAYNRGLNVHYDGYRGCPTRVTYNIYHDIDHAYLTFPAFHIHWSSLFNWKHTNHHHHGTLYSYHHHAHSIYHKPFHLKKHKHGVYTHRVHKQHKHWHKKKWHHKKWNKSHKSHKGHAHYRSSKWKKNYKSSRNRWKRDKRSHSQRPKGHKGHHGYNGHKKKGHHGNYASSKHPKHNKKQYKKRPHNNKRPHYKKGHPTYKKKQTKKRFSKRPPQRRHSRGHHR